MTNPINAPAGFVPEMAMSFADPATGAAVRVNADNALPVTERPFRGAVPIVPDTDQIARRGIAIACQSAGDLQLRLDDGSLFTLPVQPGLAILPLAVRTIVSAGTSATVTCSNLV